MPISVTELRVGMTIIETSGRRTEVKKLSPCTQRRKVHVNEKDCYDFCGKINIV